MTDTNDKLRALFLAALMVMSVFAMTVAFTGSAAADHTGDGPDADEHLVSQNTYWQGQELWFDSNGFENDDDEVQVRRITSDGAIGNLVSEEVVHPDGNATIDTSNLDGDYVVVNSSNVLQFGSTGVASLGPTRASVNAGENASDFGFEVAVQDLSAEFDDDDLPVTTGETATIEVDSTRGTYTVNVSADGLDEDDLEEIFNQSEDENDVVLDSLGDEDNNDLAEGDADGRESIQINTTGSGDIIANFTVFHGAGEYTFDFDVSDTTAQASATVELAAWSLSGQFDRQEIPVGSTSDLQVQSNRSGSFTLNISASQLSEGELASVFNQSSDGNSVVSASTDDADENESIQLETSDGEAITANFSAFPEPGNYTFDLRMSDFEASDSANVEVGSDTQQFSYNLTLKNGTVYTMGFPGPINGTYGDLFGHFEGTVWEYDAAGDAWRHPGPDEAVDPLDAVIIVPEEDATVTIDFADSDSNAGTPGERTVYTGWNFIGAPQYSDAETSYGATTGSLGRILDVYSQPGDQPFAKGGDFAVYTFDQGGSPPRVSAFTGYWVYVEENGTIGANLYRGVTFSDAEDLLQE